MLIFNSNLFKSLNRPNLIHFLATLSLHPDILRPCFYLYSMFANTYFEESTILAPGCVCVERVIKIMSLPSRNLKSVRTDITKAHAIAKKR